MVNHTVINQITRQLIRNAVYFIQEWRIQNSQANGLIECDASENVQYSVTETNTALDSNTHKEGMRMEFRSKILHSSAILCTLV